MQNLLRKTFVVLVYSLLPLIVSCSSISKDAHVPDGLAFKAIKASGPFHLKLKAEEGRETTTRYHSHSHIYNYEGEQLIRERDEVVEFSIINNYTHINPANGDLTYISTAVDKDGIVDLNDLAFPEVKEKIEFILTSDGEVLKAGAYDETSVFFLPPIPLPGRPVEIGDTWEVSKEWIAKNNGIPLQVNVVGILKAIVGCNNQPCALIEISGSVGVLADESFMAQFSSELQGFMVFSIEKGDLLWSVVKSTETLFMPESGSKVSSCMNSQLIEPKTWKIELPPSYKTCELPSL